MARNVEVLPEGVRLTDYLGVGMIARSFPYGVVADVVYQSGRQTMRRRDLPANVMLYYVIVTALYAKTSSREVLRCVLEGLHWLSEPAPVAGCPPKGGKMAKVAGKSGISQARARLGLDPVRRLHDQVVRPIATSSTRRAWWGDRRLVTLDGATLDVGIDPDNVRIFGGPGPRGQVRRPRIRFASLVEYGTHVLFGSQMGPHGQKDAVLAGDVVAHLDHDMLCLAGPRYFDAALWHSARTRGAELAWRAGSGLRLDGGHMVADGSFIGWLTEGMAAGQPVRVIDWPARNQDGDRGPLVTSLLNHETATGPDLIELYRDRGDAALALEKLKTFMSKSRIVLRSKKPDLVGQEFYGMMMAHFAIRSLIHDAEDGDGLMAREVAPLIAELAGEDAGAESVDPD